MSEDTKDIEQRLKDIKQFFTQMSPDRRHRETCDDAINEIARLRATTATVTGHCGSCGLPVVGKPHCCGNCGYMSPYGSGSKEGSPVDRAILAGDRSLITSTGEST